MYYSIPVLIIIFMKSEFALESDSDDPLPDKRNLNVDIREMELDDLPRVFDLGEKLFTADKWLNLYRTWDEYELVERFNADGEFCLVAEVDEKLVGFAIGTLIEKRKSAWVYGYLIWIGVDTSVSGRGVGKKLLQHMKNLFIENGARIMLVDTSYDNKVAIDFFGKNGFKDEVKHVYLSKNLTKDARYIRMKKKSK